MQNQHRLARGLANSDVVDAQFGHRLTGVEAKVFDDGAGFFGRWIIGGKRRERD